MIFYFVDNQYVINVFICQKINQNFKSIFLFNVLILFCFKIKH